MPYDPSDLRLPPWLVRLMDLVVRIELRIGPWRFGVTRPGALFLTMLLGVCAAAVYSGNNLLYLCGSMLLVFAGTALLNGIILLRRIPLLTPSLPDHTMAGISHVIRELLPVNYRFPAMVEIVWKCEDKKDVSIALGMRLSRGMAVLSGAMKAESRGIKPLRHLIFQTSAPLGLWRVSLKREEPWEWVVIPMPVALYNSNESIQKIKSLPGDEWRDLRSYVPGDLRSRIHWRKMPVGISDPQYWVVKQFASGSGEDQASLLRVDMRVPSGMAPDAIDRLLGQAVTWVSNSLGCNMEGRRLIVGSEACDILDAGIWKILAKAETEAKPPAGNGGKLLSLVSPR